MAAGQTDPIAPDWLTGNLLKGPTASLTIEHGQMAYRILCDVTASDKNTLEKALSVAQLELYENWNCGTPNDPHVGSIMLACRPLPFIGVFALLESGCREVWLSKGQTVVGIDAHDPPDRVEAFKGFHADDLVRRFGYAGTAGDHNQHMMPGPVV